MTKMFNHHPLGLNGMISNLGILNAGIPNKRQIGGFSNNIPSYIKLIKNIFTQEMS